jgi:hypothetical protein
MCNSDGTAWGTCDCGAGTSVAVAIGPNGGVVEAGNARLEVPPGALSQTVTIELFPVASSSPDVLGSIYGFMPDGLAFAVPATLAIRLDAASSSNNSSLTDIRIATSVDGLWVALPSSSVDATGSTLLALIPHFTAFAPVGEPWTSFVPSQGCQIAVHTSYVPILPHFAKVCDEITDFLFSSNECAPESALTDCAPCTNPLCVENRCWCASSNSPPGGPSAAAKDGGSPDAGGVGPDAAANPCFGVAFQGTVIYDDQPDQPLEMSGAFDSHGNISNVDINGEGEMACTGGVAANGSVFSITFGGQCNQGSPTCTCSGTWNGLAMGASTVPVSGSWSLAGVSR